MDTQSSISLKHTSEMLSESWPKQPTCTRQGKTVKTGGGGSRLGCGDFSNCSPQMGMESMHTVLITYRPSPSYLQPKWRGWICASRNNTSPFFIPSNLCQLQTTMCHCLWTWSRRKEMKVRGEKNWKLPLPSFTFTICPLLVAGNWFF